MSVTASPALITASWAASTNDRPTGNRRNSDVCDKNTRRGDGRLPVMTPEQPSTHPILGGDSVRCMCGGGMDRAAMLARAGLVTDLPGRVWLTSDLSSNGP